MAERTLVGWNFPNLVTVPSMALIMFLLFALGWQLIKPLIGGGGSNVGSTGF